MSKVAASTLAISRELQNIAKRLDKDLEGVAGERVCFSLFVWCEGYANYVSTKHRAQIIPVLEAMIARWKAGDPQPPVHKVN